MKREFFTVAGARLPRAIFAGLMLALVVLAGCATSTNYLQIITPHTAADLLADNVELFEGSSYDDAALQAAEAGYEVILSYERKTNGKGT